MNPRILTRCTETARALKPNNQTHKSFHVSFAIRKSKIVAIGINNYCKLHPKHKFGRYQDHKGFETEYRASLHSEVNLATRMGEDNWNDYEIVNVRIGANDRLAMAKCCPNCERLIIQPLAPKRLFYSDNEGNFQEHKYWN